MNPIRLIIRPALLLLLLAIAHPAARAAFSPIMPSPRGVIDLPMLTDPTLPARKHVLEFNPALKPLWLKALARPEPDLRAQAALAFGKAAGEGMPHLQDVAPKLIAMLKDDQVQSVRLAAAYALVEMQDTSAADALVVAEKRDGAAIASIVNPALARWRTSAAMALWRKQVIAADTVYPVRLSAVRSLGTAKDAAAWSDLLKIAADSDDDQTLRLAAARSLGDIPSSKVVDTVASLAAGKSFGQLLAALMLAHHDDPRSVNILLRLAAATQGAPSVAAAVTSLNTINPAETAARAASLLRCPDPDARLATVRALATQPSAEAVKWLGQALSDPIPTINRAARRALEADAKIARLRSAVVAAIREQLQSSAWQGREQAALLAKMIDDKSSASKIVSLLTSTRPEVRLAAAAALRRLAVPSTLPAMLFRAKALAKDLKQRSLPEPKSASDTREIVQLLQGLGTSRDAKAQPLLRRFVPKVVPGKSGVPVPFPSDARAAAIWSLGKIHTGKLDAQLAKQLAGRIEDMSIQFPEATSVKCAAAVALARMHATAELPTLRRFGVPSADQSIDFKVTVACQWAVAQITGKAMPPLPPVIDHATGWFLEPARDDL